FAKIRHREETARLEIRWVEVEGKGQPRRGLLSAMTGSMYRGYRRVLSRFGFVSRTKSLRFRRARSLPERKPRPGAILTRRVGDVQDRGGHGRDKR
ncbi:hypothetical protein DRP77_04635, partial [Candidatus Poribacteria bacterium]